MAIGVIPRAHWRYTNRARIGVIRTARGERKIPQLPPMPPAAAAGGEPGCGRQGWLETATRGFYASFFVLRNHLPIYGFSPWVAGPPRAPGRGGAGWIPTTEWKFEGRLGVVRRPPTCGGVGWLLKMRRSRLQSACRYGWVRQGLAQGWEGGGPAAGGGTHPPGGPPP